MQSPKTEQSLACWENSEDQGGRSPLSKEGAADEAGRPVPSREKFLPSEGM